MGKPPVPVGGPKEGPEHVEDPRLVCNPTRRGRKNRYDEQRIPDGASLAGDTALVPISHRNMSLRLGVWQRRGTTISH